MKVKKGQRFILNRYDGQVLMEVVKRRAGDVWNCEPVKNLPDEPDDADAFWFCQEYGEPMVFTDAQVAKKVDASRADLKTHAKQLKRRR